MTTKDVAGPVGKPAGHYSWAMAYGFAVAEARRTRRRQRVWREEPHTWRTEAL